MCISKESIKRFLAALCCQNMSRSKAKEPYSCHLARLKLSVVLFTYGLFAPAPTMTNGMELAGLFRAHSSELPLNPDRQDCRRGERRCGPHPQKVRRMHNASISPPFSPSSPLLLSSSGRPGIHLFFAPIDAFNRGCVSRTRRTSRLVQGL